MTADELRRLEKRAAKLLAKSQRAAEKAHREEVSARQIRLPSMRLGRVTMPGAGRPRSLFARPPRNSIRMAAADGTIPFHMRISSVSKAAPIEGSDMSSAGATAAAHQLYVEREQALAEAGLERGSAAEATQGYIEREGATMASFGTIGDTLEERISFWGRVEEAERTPHQHEVSLAIEDDAAIAAALASLTPEAPAALTRLLTDRSPMKVDTKVMRAVTAYCREQGFDDLVAFREGRGGVVQRRLVLELPADMTAADRHRIATRFCEEVFESRGVRYHCAIHAPTPKNDDRNHHFHLAFYDRPTEKVIDPATGALVWDFEVVETYKTSSRHSRTRRPLQQPKDASFDARGWPKATRETYCRIVNAVRADAGQRPIYHPTTYKAAGVDVEPMPNLTRKEFHDLQRGIDNPAALAKIVKRWERLALIQVAPEGAFIAGTKPAAPPPRRETIVDAVTRRAPFSRSAAIRLRGEQIQAERARDEIGLAKTAVDLVVREIARGALPEITARGAALDDLRRRLMTGVAQEEAPVVAWIAKLDAKERAMRAELDALPRGRKRLRSDSILPDGLDLLDRAGLRPIHDRLAQITAAQIAKAREASAPTADAAPAAPVVVSEPPAPPAPQVVEPVAPPVEPPIAATPVIPKIVEPPVAVTPPPAQAVAPADIAQVVEPVAPIVVPAVPTTAPIEVAPKKPKLSLFERRLEESIAAEKRFDEGIAKSIPAIRRVFEKNLRLPIDLRAYDIMPGGAEEAAWRQALEKAGRRVDPASYEARCEYMVMLAIHKAIMPDRAPILALTVDQTPRLDDRDPWATIAEGYRRLFTTELEKAAPKKAVVTAPTAAEIAAAKAEAEREEAEHWARIKADHDKRQEEERARTLARIDAEERRRAAAAARGPMQWSDLEPASRIITRDSTGDTKTPTETPVDASTKPAPQVAPPTPSVPITHPAVPAAPAAPIAEVASPPIVASVAATVTTPALPRDPVEPARPKAPDPVRSDEPKKQDPSPDRSADNRRGAILAKKRRNKNRGWER